MYRRPLTIAAAGLCGALLFAGPGAAGPDHKNKFKNDNVDTRPCGDDGDTVTYTGPTLLWPPNHKLTPYYDIVAQGDPDDEVVLDLSTADVTDVAGGDGGSNHDPDLFFNPESGVDEGMEQAIVAVSMRAERSGKGEGRTYNINYIATFTGTQDGDVDNCMGTFEVNVPHDMGDPAIREQRTNGNKNS